MLQYLSCILIFTFITASVGVSPVEYTLQRGQQCGQDTDIPDKQLMEVLKDIQLELSAPIDCRNIYQKGHTTSGVYTINPDNQTTFKVYCDMDTDGGGWTVFQRRMDGSVVFSRNWVDYATGFGNLTGEYWLGLENMHRLTSSSAQELRVDLEDFEDNTAFAVYKTFSIASATDKYRILVTDYTGTAGDAMYFNSGQQFSTIDQDNDAWPGDCVELRGGSWWHNTCTHANLNSNYYYYARNDVHGIIWYQWKGNFISLKRASMMMRRK